jgi:hypothetical protein
MPYWEIVAGVAAAVALATLAYVIPAYAVVTPF